MIFTTILPSLVEISRSGWSTVPGAITRPIGLAGSMAEPRTVSSALPPSSPLIIAVGLNRSSVNSSRARAHRRRPRRCAAGAGRAVASPYHTRGP